jgi:hypothetical protein
MISELRNSVRSRISLRSKHMEKLEEQKANLNEIKTKALSHQKLLQRKNSETQITREKDHSTLDLYENPKSIFKKFRPLERRLTISTINII